jgi:2,3-bisphosphoglycerate-independent phosphoglycerate mutase
MAQLKVIFIVLDGLSDRAWSKLGDLTPLEAADTPNLDFLSSKGANGLLYSLSPGLAPGSDSAHFVLFGYPLAEFPGRGVFEAVGEGVPFDETDIVCRASLGCVERRNEILWVKRRNFPLSEEECLALVEEIKKFNYQNFSFTLTYNQQRQAILRVKGQGSPDITDSDPFADNLPVIKVEPLNSSSEVSKAAKTAEALNAYLSWVFQILSNHPVNKQRVQKNLFPANFLFTKWFARRRKKHLPFGEKYGFKAVSIASGVLYRGLMTELGLAYIEAPQIKEVERDLKRRFELAEEAVDSGFDFIHIHTKAADQAAHEKDPILKKNVIEKLDLAFDYLLSSEKLMRESVIIVTADHSTPSGTSLIHSGEPAPITIWGETVWRDNVCSFSERSCAEGILGSLKGEDIMPLILNFTNRILYFGVRPNPEQTFFLPPRINPFTIEK